MWLEWWQERAMRVTRAQARGEDAKKQICRQPAQGMAAHPDVDEFQSTTVVQPWLTQLASEHKRH
jgi:hypothetical protein